MIELPMTVARPEMPADGPAPYDIEHTDVSIDGHTLSLEHICHGVMVDAPDGGKRLVKVTPRQEYQVPMSETSLWEYEDEAGNVRACLLRVPAKTDGPIWSIHPDAGKDIGGVYYEVHQAIAGRGEMQVDHGRDTNPNALPTERFDLSVIRMMGNVAGAVCIHPGDRFAIDSDRCARTDAWVLATFPGAPFQQHYETRVG
jgi:hypothetical protein